MNQKKHKIWKQIPNCVTILRMVSCVALLFLPPMGRCFVALYLFAGFTDMLDGWLARKLNASTDFGSKLDSVADLLFVVCCAVKLWPLLHLPMALWMLLGVIVMARLTNLMISIKRFHKPVFLHTIANKLTGLLLFVAVLFIQQTFFVWIALALSILALFASVQEGYKISQSSQS